MTLAHTAMYACVARLGARPGERRFHSITKRVNRDPFLQLQGCGAAPLCQKKTKHSRDAKKRQPRGVGKGQKEEPAYGGNDLRGYDFSQSCVFVVLSQHLPESGPALALYNELF